MARRIACASGSPAFSGSSSATRAETPNSGLSGSMLTVCPWGACTGWSMYTVASLAANQPVAPFPLPSTAIFSVRYVHMRSACQVLAEEVADPAPAVHRGLHPVRRPVDREERMAGAVVGVELVRLV